MNQLRKQVQGLTQRIGLNKIDQLPLGKMLKDKTTVSLSQATLVLGPLLTLIALLLNFQALVVSVVCCLGPAMLSFQALESPNVEDDKKYLTYWVLYAVKEVISPFFYLVCGSKLLLLLRVSFTILLLHPRFAYSIEVYQRYIAPFLKQYESRIDSNINQIYEKGKKVVINGLVDEIKKMQ